MYCRPRDQARGGSEEWGKQSCCPGETESVTGISGKGLFLLIILFSIARHEGCGNIWRDLSLIVKILLSQATSSLRFALFSICVH